MLRFEKLTKTTRSDATRVVCLLKATFGRDSPHVA
jgi:hypothetical protein